MATTIGDLIREQIALEAHGKSLLVYKDNMHSLLSSRGPLYSTEDAFNNSIHYPFIEHKIDEMLEV